MKIRDMSKFFGIPMETLRFYESKGILTPAREDGNQYRSYDMESWSKMAQAMLLKNMGISLSHIAEFFETGSTSFLLKCVVEEIERKQLDINGEMRVLQWMKAYKEMIETLPHNVGRFWYTKQPSYKYIIHLRRESNRYELIDNPTLIDVAAGWRKQTPFVEVCGFTSQENVEKKVNCSDWGLRVPAEMVDCLPIPRCEYEQDIPACLGLTTVLDEITDDNYTEKVSPGLQIIKDDGYCLAGPITSACKLVIYRKDCQHRYHEIFYPIKILTL